MAPYKNEKGWGFRTSTPAIDHPEETQGDRKDFT
jgi:hypothetical protein